jgi:hypothetical protein
MIVLNLSCANDHRFEGWFATRAEFDRQSSAGGVICPVCGDHAVSRLPSNPHVAKAMPAASAGETGGVAGRGPGPDLGRVLDVVHAAWKGSEDVGERFPEEARRIHYREAPSRSIRGVATRAEATELAEEGIQVMALPFPPADKMH